MARQAPKHMSGALKWNVRPSAPSLPLVLTAIGAIIMFILCALRCASRQGFAAWVLIFPAIAVFGQIAQLWASHVKVGSGRVMERRDVVNLTTGFLAVVAVVFGGVLYMVW